MARLFDDASSEYLEIASALGLSLPFTMATFFYTDDDTLNEALMWVGYKDWTDTFYSLHCGPLQNGLVADARKTPMSTSFAVTTADYSANTWHHGCAVFAATNSRAAYLDGGNKGTDATLIDTITPDRTSIGRCGDSTPGGYFSGSIAWPAIWNVALTDDEVAQLALGVCPLLIRPQNLVAFWPLGGLYGQKDTDPVGGLHMTAYNTPTWAEHPGALWYPRGLSVGVPTAAAADVGPIGALRTLGRRPPIRRPGSRVVRPPRRLPFVPFLLPSTVARAAPALRPGSRLPWPGYTPAPAADVYPIRALQTTGRRRPVRRPGSRVVRPPRRIPFVPILLSGRSARAAARRELRRKSLAADPSVFRARFRHDARGLYRVFNAAEYRFYRDNAAPPVEGDVPFATSATLPHTPADVFADATWYLSVSYFNGVIDSGFLPLGPAGETYLRLDLADGEESGSPPAGPTDWRLALDAAGVVRVVGFYWESGSLRADQWALAYTTDGGAPAADAPDVTATMAAGLAILDYALPGQADGTTVKVRLQTRRDDDGDWVYSEDSVVKTITADAAGPTAPLDAQRWAGALPEE